MTCPECNHKKGERECYCCCSISQIGCPYCILPVLGYRQVKKMIRILRGNSKVKTKA